MTMTESQFSKETIKWIKANYPDVMVANIHGSGWSIKGFPDLVLCIRGRFIALELKVGKNNMQPDQRVWKTIIERAGGQHYCPRSLTEVKEIIERNMYDNDSERC